MNQPKIRAVYFPPRITEDGIEIPGGYEAILVNVHEVEFETDSSFFRHETAEGAIRELIIGNSWSEEQCITEIIAL